MGDSPTWLGLSGRQRDVLVAVVATSPATTTEVVEQLATWHDRGVSRIAARHIFPDLEEKGLLVSDSRGSENSYRATEAGVKLVLERAAQLDYAVHEAGRLMAGGGLDV